MVKILHLLESSRFSGAENVVCQIIDMFKDEPNIEMAYCSADGPIAKTLKERDILFYPMKKLCVMELRKIIKEYNPDVIHAHDFSASVLASIWSKKIEIISHIHNNPPWLKKRGFNSIAYRFVLKRIKNVYGVSNSIYNEYVFKKSLDGKFYRIGNPIDTNRIILRSCEYNYSEHFDLGYCGRLAIPKNPLLFVDIVKRIHDIFPNIHACMIGDGPLKLKVQNYIHQERLENYISLLGYHDNPYPIIKNCKIICMPSLWEGFGLVAVEALSLGVPVLCSNAGGLPSIVDNHCGRICQTLNDYVDTALELLENNESLFLFRKNAKNRAKELDNYDSYKHFLLDKYLLVKKDEK